MPRRTRIKICGCTTAREATAAAELGVDAVGVIFAPTSPRCVDLRTAREIATAVPAYVSLVGVFVAPRAADVRAAVEAGFLPQFSGDEDAATCEELAPGPYIKVFRLAAGDGAPLDPLAFAQAASAYQRATPMLETGVAGRHGGTGRAFAWERALPIARRSALIVSGGLTPDNVGACVRAIRPYGVDVRSGVERAGVKDLAMMRAFVRAVEDVDAQT